jgi:preprotein translocase subunit YajC
VHYLTPLIFVVVIVALFLFSGRARRRQAAARTQQAERIGVGTEVMTTSGLYGTVVGVNPDGTVLLSIAPGVEVRWDVAALRDVASLPERYRRGLPGTGPATGPGTDQADGGSGASGDPGDSGVNLRKDD